MTLFDDAFGGPGAVITRRASTFEDLPTATRDRLSTLGMSLVALTGAADRAVAVVDDLDDTYGTWLDELDADTVIVRPDFHLYGAFSASMTASAIDDFVSRVTGSAPAFVRS
jgi:3-(3-hydroxy-phenyl)propionate hydroxylase